MSASLIDELKSRIVIRVAMAYVAGTWLLLQVMDVVAEPLGWPTWIQTATIFALAGGFPVALLVGFVMDLRRKGAPSGPAPTADEAATDAPAETRLAVLPFVALDGGDDEFLGDGIAEDIISTVARQAKISVIARASSFRFRGADVSIAEVRDQLRASHAITGSVRRAGERLRISVQLIDTSDESQQWSESFQRSSDDIFAVQSDIARSVGRALIDVLNLEISVRQREWDLAPAAYEQYLMAQAAFHRADFPKALEHAGVSRQIDAENPLVATLLAQVYLYWPRYGFGVTIDQLRQARASTEQALSIDPTHPPARAAQGMLSLYMERDFQTAYTTVVNAATEQPEVAEWLPVLLTYAGRTRDAIELQQRIVARDPLNTFNLATLANRMNWIGRPQEAQRLFAKVGELDPTNVIMHNAFFRGMLRNEDIDGAKHMMREWGMDPDEPGEATRSWLPRSISLWFGARLYGVMGEHERAVALAREIENEQGFTPTTVAEAYLSAGAMDDAYRIWQLGFERSDPGIYDLARPQDMRDPDDPLWLEFAGDPRFEAMLEKLGIAPGHLRDVDWTGLDLVLD